MPTVKEILCQARRVIELPEHWCQEVSAKTANGTFLSFGARNSDAVSFCLIGAIARACFMFRLERDCELELAAIGAVAFEAKESVWRFNDRPGRTHAEVLALLDRVIATV